MLLRLLIPGRRQSNPYSLLNHPFSPNNRTLGRQLNRLHLNPISPSLNPISPSLSRTSLHLSSTNLNLSSTSPSLSLINLNLSRTNLNLSSTSLNFSSTSLNFSSIRQNSPSLSHINLNSKAISQVCPPRLPLLHLPSARARD